ncbi:MAG TPA: DegT/DnrJ/EryC1/StrS family aminotransferase [Candidatus Aerophobetes bacterium]|uniref:DegT/DnrJ/EryC1/StrS family aminotransferase n=1 Tax=Aerophobetes bacterium TaxID=2030807 RepID=A0A7V0MYC7_UNCAE|nr:DegT/DnrJ/EryC1/StrS family aminotransferase [Candidatus Aerophobetes bacterium]
MTNQQEKLAIEGGKPTIQEKLPTWPWFSEEIIQAAMQPLRTGKVNYWTGNLGMEFERKFAKWCGTRYAISTCNGTSALHTALGALNIGPGDEVITVPYTFIATSFCVVQAGAIPVFADVQREDHCIDPEDIKKKITPRTRAIIPVHLYGNVCEMDEIMDIAKKYGLYVIEDAAEAHGALYKGKKVGSIGDVGCFSFCQNKTFTTGGEGGMVVTNNEDIAWEARSFRDHGYDVKRRMSLLEMEQALPYIHRRVGFNYRMTEVQSAIGIKELERIDSWNLPRRRRNGEILIEELKDCPQIKYLPVHNKEKVNGFYVFPVVLNLERLTCDKNTFLKAILAEGVIAWKEFWPQSYKEKAYTEHNGFGRFKFPFESKEYTDPKQVEYNKVFCPNCAWLEERTFVVHMFPTFEEEHIRLIAKAIKKVASYYAK